MTVEPDLHRVVETLVQVDHHAREGSIAIVKERRLGDVVVLAVAFEDRDGGQRRGLLGLRTDEGGWRRCGEFIGSTHVTRDSETWMTSGGWGVPSATNAAVFGGWVADPHAVAARAVDIDGRVLEDDVENDVENDVVIFMYLHGFNLQYAQLELLAADGQVLRSGPL
jgi:hypothetical protein